MPKLGFGRRRSAEVLDGEPGEWSLDSVKLGFAPPQPRASGLLSWGSQFFCRRQGRDFARTPAQQPWSRSSSRQLHLF